MKLTDEEITEIITSTVIGPLIDMDGAIQDFREIVDEWSDDLKAFLVTLAGHDRSFLVALAHAVIAMCLHAEDSMVDRGLAGADWYRGAGCIEAYWQENGNGKIYDEEWLSFKDRWMASKLEASGVCKLIERWNEKLVGDQQAGLPTVNYLIQDRVEVKKALREI